MVSSVGIDIKSTSVDVFTLHAFGLQLCTNNTPFTDEEPGGDEEAPPAKRPRRQRRCAVDPDKAHRVWRDLVGPERAATDWLRLRNELDRWRQEGLQVEVGETAPRPRPLVEAVLESMLGDRTTLDPDTNQRKVSLTRTFGLVTVRIKRSKYITVCITTSGWQRPMFMILFW